MQDVEHRKTVVYTTAGQLITFTFPPETEVGWYAILTITNGEGALDSVPPGWTLLADLDVPVSLLRTFVYAKFVTGEEGAMTFDSAVNNVAAHLHLFSGVDTINPLYITDIDLNAASTTITLTRAPFLTDGSRFFYLWSTTDGTSAITPHASSTQLAQTATPNNSARMCSAMELSSGLPRNTGGRNATQANSAASSGFAIALVPAADDSIDDDTEARDLYKSIVLRNRLPRTFNRRRDGMFAKVLAPCGESDNAIGGLFGDRNFLDTSTTVHYSTVRRIDYKTALAVDANNITVAVPNGKQPGYRLVAIIAKNANGASAISTPAGWTKIGEGTNTLGGGLTMKVAFYEKNVDMTEGGSFNWTWSETTVGAVGFMVLYASTPGVDAQNLPAARDADAIQASSIAFSNTVPRTVLAVFAGNQLSPWTVPKMTELVDATAGVGAPISVVIAEEQFEIGDLLVNRAGLNEGLVWTMDGLGGALTLPAQALS